MHNTGTNSYYLSVSQMLYRTPFFLQFFSGRTGLLSGCNDAFASVSVQSHLLPFTPPSLALRRHGCIFVFLPFIVYVHAHNRTRTRNHVHSPSHTETLNHLFLLQATFGGKLKKKRLGGTYTYGECSDLTEVAMDPAVYKMLYSIKFKREDIAKQAKKIIKEKFAFSTRTRKTIPSGKTSQTTPLPSTAYADLHRNDGPQDLSPHPCSMAGRSCRTLL